MNVTSLSFSSQIDTAEEGKALATFAGEIDLLGAPDFKAQLLRLVEQGRHQIVVDFTDVHFIDSTTLGALVSVLKQLRGVDGSLKVVSGEGQPSKVFAVSGLDRVFPVCATRELALS